MKTLGFACALVLAAGTAHAAAPATPAPASDILAATKRLMLPLIVKNYGGTCRGELGHPVTVGADGMLGAGPFRRDLLARAVALDVSQEVVGGKPGWPSFDARVFGQFNAKLVQDTDEVMQLEVGEKKVECRVKRVEKAGANPRLYPMIAPLTNFVTSELGCMSHRSNVSKRKIVLTPAGLSVDGELTPLVQPRGREELMVHDDGIIYAFTADGKRTSVSFDAAGELREITATVRGMEMSCLKGL